MPGFFDLIKYFRVHPCSSMSEAWLWMWPFSGARISQRQGKESPFQSVCVWIIEHLWLGQEQRSHQLTSAWGSRAQGLSCPEHIWLGTSWIFCWQIELWCPFPPPSEELVVLGQVLRRARGHLPWLVQCRSNHKAGNESIFSFPGTVRNMVPHPLDWASLNSWKDSVTGSFSFTLRGRHLHRVLTHRLGNTFQVGHCATIPYHLGTTSTSGELPSFPVILV